jgi:Zn-dependent peptidase ImmA (M78 family)
LSYNYKSKTPTELETISQSLLARFPFALKNGKPDIELLVEKYPLKVIPRVGLNKLTVLDAYLPRVDGIMLVDAELANDLPRYRLTLAEEISHRELEPDLWKAGVPVGACIYELDAQLYDDVEGDAYRLALAILMPALYFKERFQLLKNQITAAAKEPKDINPLTVEIMAKEFEVTFDACASRCHILNICKVQIKKPQLPGSVIF